MPERKNDAKAEGLSHKKEAARPLDKRKKKDFRAISPKSSGHRPSSPPKEDKGRRTGVSPSVPEHCPLHDREVIKKKGDPTWSKMKALKVQ